MNLPVEILTCIFTYTRFSGEKFSLTWPRVCKAWHLISKSEYFKKLVELKKASHEEIYKLFGTACENHNLPVAKVNDHYKIL